jgi:hypothetical protein
MCSLAASSCALKAARPMTARAISQAFGAAVITAARQPGQRPDADRCVLCIYCQSDKFVYGPAVCRRPGRAARRSRLSSAPGLCGSCLGWAWSTSAGCRPRRRCSPGACMPPQSPPDLPHPQPARWDQGCRPAGACVAASDRPRKSLPRRGPPAGDRHPCRGNPALVILGQLLVSRACIRRLL